MYSLRDRWRRSWPYHYFADLAPRDRAVVLVAIVLAAAAATLCAVLMQPRDASVGLSPDVTAPPFVLQFAEVRR